MATLLNSSRVYILVGKGAKGQSPRPSGAVGKDDRCWHPRPEAAVGGRRGRRIGPMAGILFTDGITLTKEGQVFSKLNPQASAVTEEPGSQRSNSPANCQEQKGERPVYLHMGEEIYFVTLLNHYIP